MSLFINWKNKHLDWKVRKENLNLLGESSKYSEWFPSLPRMSLYMNGETKQTMNMWERESKISVVSSKQTVCELWPILDCTAENRTECSFSSIEQWAETSVDLLTHEWLTYAIRGRLLLHWNDQWDEWRDRQKSERTEKCSSNVRKLPSKWFQSNIAL